MKIEMKYSEILIAANALHALGPKELNPTAALQVRRISAIVQPVIDEYNEEIVKILARHVVSPIEAQHNKMTNGSTLPDEFVIEATELLEATAEIDITPIDSDKLADSQMATISVNLMNGLGVMLSA